MSIGVDFHHEQNFAKLVQSNQIFLKYAHSKKNIRKSLFQPYYNFLGGLKDYIKMASV